MTVSNIGRYDIRYTIYDRERERERESSKQQEELVQVVSKAKTANWMVERSVGA